MHLKHDCATVPGDDLVRTNPEAIGPPQIRDDQSVKQTCAAVEWCVMVLGRSSTCPVCSSTASVSRMCSGSTVVLAGLGGPPRGLGLPPVACISWSTMTAHSRHPSTLTTGAAGFVNAASSRLRKVCHPSERRSSQRQGRVDMRGLRACSTSSHNSSSVSSCRTWDQKKKAGP